MFKLAQQYLGKEFSIQAVAEFWLTLVKMLR